MTKTFDYSLENHNRREALDMADVRRSPRLRKRKDGELKKSNITMDPREAASMQMELNRKLVAERKKSPGLLDYFYATRPWSFPCIIAPTLISIVLAMDHPHFSGWIAFFNFLFLLFTHIVGNLANSYYDFVGGNDTDEKKGKASGDRALLDGVMSVGEIWWMMFISGVLAILIAGGLFVHFLGVLPARVQYQLLAEGVAGFFMAYFYTAPPISFKLHALGEVCLFLCFGILPICGSYALFTLGAWDFERTLLASLPVGILTALVLHCNNTRDAKDDARMGGFTIAMTIGFNNAFLVYIVVLLSAYAVTLYEAYILSAPIFCLVILSAPKAIQNIVMFKNKDLVNLDEETAKLVGLYGLLQVIALYIHYQY